MMACTFAYCPNSSSPKEESALRLVVLYSSGVSLVVIH